MRCYDWEYGVLTEGLPVTAGKNGIPAVLLGDPAGAGHRVFFHKENPPEVEEGRVHEVYPMWIRPRTGATSFLVLAAPHEKHREDRRALVRVSTWAAETFSSEGFWRGFETPVATMLTGSKPYVCTRGNKVEARYGLVKLGMDQVLRVRPVGTDLQWALSMTEQEELRAEYWEHFMIRTYDG